MKCINCGTDNNLRDRTEHQGRCKHCGTPFALEPTTMGDKKITDAAFLKILNDISANGTLYFTKQQLFYRDRQASFEKTRFTVFICLFLHLCLACTLFYPSDVLEPFCPTNTWFGLHSYMVIGVVV